MDVRDTPQLMPTRDLAGSRATDNRLILNSQEGLLEKVTGRMEKDFPSSLCPLLFTWGSDLHIGRKVSELGVSTDWA